MFYIFHGDDTHKQKETVAQLIAKLGDPAMLDLNTARFPGIMPFTTLRQVCDSIPFLAPARIVIVYDLIQAKPDKAFMDSLLAYLPELPDSTRLIFMESKEIRSNNPLVKLAAESANGYTKMFMKPQGSQLEKWIQQRTVQKNGRISPKAVQLLANSVGNDLETLDNELEKLVAYKGYDSEIEIDTDDVSTLSPYAAEANIFDLVDAIGNRNGKVASTLLHQKLNEGEEPFRLFSMFIRQFRLLIQVKELMIAGYRPQGISRELHLPGFVASKLYQQARGFGLEELEHIYLHLLEIDVAVKTGHGELTTSLDLLVADLTIIT